MGTHNHPRRQPAGRSDGGQFATLPHAEDPPADDADLSAGDPILSEITGNLIRLPVRLVQTKQGWSLAPSWQFTEFGVRMEMAAAEKPDDVFYDTYEVYESGTILADLLTQQFVRPEDANIWLNKLDTSPAYANDPDLTTVTTIVGAVIKLELNEDWNRLLAHGAPSDGVANPAPIYAPDWAHTILQDSVPEKHPVPDWRHSLRVCFAIIAEEGKRIGTCSPTRLAAVSPMGGRIGDTTWPARLFEQATSNLPTRGDWLPLSTARPQGYPLATVLLSKAIELGHDPDALQQWLETQRLTNVDEESLVRILEEVLKKGPDRLAAASVFAAIWEVEAAEGNFRPADALRNMLLTGRRHSHPTARQMLRSAETGFRNHDTLVQHIRGLRPELLR